MPTASIDPEFVEFWKAWPRSFSWNRVCDDRERRLVARLRTTTLDFVNLRDDLAGVAGALLAQTTETVSLETLSFQRSADVLVILILGGAGRLYGGLVGAIIYMVARDQFSGINPQYWYFWIGTLLVAVVIFLPNGVLGGAARLVRLGRSRA